MSAEVLLDEFVLANIALNYLLVAIGFVSQEFTSIQAFLTVLTVHLSIITNLNMLIQFITFHLIKTEGAMHQSIGAFLLVLFEIPFQDRYITTSVAARNLLEYALLLML